MKPTRCTGHAAVGGSIPAPGPTAPRPTPPPGGRALTSYCRLWQGRLQVKPVHDIADLWVAGPPRTPDLGELDQAKDGHGVLRREPCPAHGGNEPLIFPRHGVPESLKSQDRRDGGIAPVDQVNAAHAHPRGRYGGAGGGAATCSGDIVGTNPRWRGPRAATP